MAIPLGGEPLLQAMPAPGGRPERSMGGPLATGTELETFALLMAGQAIPAETGAADALPTPKAKAAPAPPGMQGQALPWEALAAAAEEAGQLMALLQSAALAQPLPPTLPPPSSPPLPEIALPAMPLAPEQAGPAPEVIAALPEVALPEVAGPPAALASAAALLPSPGEAMPAAPAAAGMVAQPALAEPGPAAPSPAGQELPPGEQDQGPAQEQAEGQARHHSPAQALPPASLPASLAPQPLPLATAMAAAQAGEDPAATALPALVQDRAAARSLPRSSPQSPASLAEALPAPPPASAPAGLPQPPGTVPQAMATPEEAVPQLSSLWREPGKVHGPLPQKGTEFTAQPAMAGAEILPPAAEIPLPASPISLPAEAGLISWAASGPEAPAPQAPVPSQAPAHPRLPPGAAPQLVLRVKEATEAGVETVSVDLRPPELGRVELRLTFREGTVQVVMLAERAETFEALRQDRHSLMQQMEQAGLQLGGQGLDLQHGPLSWAEREMPEPAPAMRADAGPEDDPAAEPAATPRRPASDSLIDIVA